MDNKKLFRVLSLIPEENVQFYRMEYIDRKDPTDLRNYNYPRVSDNISCLYELFIEFFQNHIELNSCVIYLKSGGTIKVDCLAEKLFICGDLQFPFLDKLANLGLLGKEKSLKAVLFV
jgi:hypothetical protein